ncbi:oxygen-dependent protoporphyrinogen oxidase [Saxophila tyrrhenica]|uniref:Protoporphyrinogen oxidase n=1 Tax=Saxophila tyrrhenica TaxID=1690608 RepID=A0AAV9PBK5_9PEZI|nr:oxygen-dependent protoporphyrinogen oxidase [Saxophila tyrrhenica]
MLRNGLTTVSHLRPLYSQSSHLRIADRLRAYSTEPATSNDVAILGGGITGLACAYYITKELPQANVTIYEASDRLGGWLSSKRVPVKDGNVLFEAGPRTLRPSSNGALAGILMQELDLAKDAIFAQRTSPAARNRFVYYPDHLVRMPHPSSGLFSNLYNLWSEPIFDGVLWGAASEIFKPQRDESLQDESVGDFFARRIGPNVVNRLLSGVLHGIYAGDVWKLSAKSLFPTQWRDEAQSGSIFGGFAKARADGPEVTKQEGEYVRAIKSHKWDPLLRDTLKDTTAFTFRDGLGMLSDGLVRHLVGTGRVNFQTSSPVQAVAMSETGSGVTVKTESGEAAFANAISTLSPKHLKNIRQAKASELVPAIPGVTVMTVNLYFRSPNLAPAGFGYLIPLATPFENNPERALGVVFDTAYSPSPDDVNMENWHISSPDQLKEARDQGRLINVNDFAWYNMPDRPNTQDDVKARGTKLTVMLGGHYWDSWPAFPDEKEGLALAKSLLERHLGIKEEPEAWQVNLQSDCIPQYTVGHEQRLKTAHSNISREYKGRLRVAGNWMSGVGVNDCLRSAWDVVRSMKEGRYGTGLEHIGTNEYVRLKPIRPGQSTEQEQ